MCKFWSWTVNTRNNPLEQVNDAIERAYWKNVSFSKHLYGSDLPGSLLDKSAVADTDWNLARLPSLLQSCGLTVSPLPQPSQRGASMWKTASSNGLRGIPTIRGWPDGFAPKVQPDCPCCTTMRGPSTR